MKYLIWVYCPKIIQQQITNICLEINLVACKKTITKNWLQPVAPTIHEFLEVIFFYNINKNVQSMLAKMDWLLLITWIYYYPWCILSLFIVIIFLFFPLLIYIFCFSFLFGKMYAKVMINLKILYYKFHDVTLIYKPYTNTGPMPVSSPVAGVSKTPSLLCAELYSSRCPS